MEAGRVTFLLVGVFAGLLAGVALAYRFRAEADGVAGKLAQATSEVESLRMERDALATKLAEAEQRASSAELNLRRVEDMPVVAPTPEERAARQAQEKAFVEEQHRRKMELLRMLEGGGDDGAPDVAERTGE